MKKYPEKVWLTALMSTVASHLQSRGIEKMPPNQLMAATVQVLEHTEKTLREKGQLDDE